MDLLDENPYITAIFAANDTMALGALAAIRARGRSVPADVSVIGYDNSPLAQYRYLEITSIDDRSDVVGAAAGRALLARFDDPGRTAAHPCRTHPGGPDDYRCRRLDPGAEIAERGNGRGMGLLRHRRTPFPVTNDHGTGGRTRSRFVFHDPRQV